MPASKFFTLMFTMLCGTLFAQHLSNPVLPGVADAGVLKYNGRYYLGGVFTNGGFYVSDDLVHWQGPIHVVTMDNAWTRGTGARNNQIHSNHMLYDNGRFHLYWSVNYWGKDGHAVHIAHAESDHALGPYVEPVTAEWMDNRIDPMVFKDDDGQLYMYMVRFTDGNAIWARKMSDPSRFSSAPVCMFASLPDTWETMDNRVAEGPWVIKYRERYYMMYNANHTSTEWGNYQLGVAEADAPLAFQNGSKYSYPVVRSNQEKLEEEYVDLLRYKSTGYDPFFTYTEIRPDSGWTLPKYITLGWRKGEGGFSDREIKGSSIRARGTLWASPSLWIRKSFVLSNKTGNIAIRLVHEGDTKVYLNNTLIYDKLGRNICIFNLDREQHAALHAGENMLAVETKRGEQSAYFNISLFDMRSDKADDILMTPGQPNLLRGPNGFEWWLVYMANKNGDRRGQYIDRVHFFNKRLYVDGITGPHTQGYHPTPSLPTYSVNEAIPASGPLAQVQPANAYLFETSVMTGGEAGIWAWWKDAQNHLRIGLSPQDGQWYIRATLEGNVEEKRFTLPKSFRWNVYHHFRVERNNEELKVWIDGIPAPQQHRFVGLLPRNVPGVPGMFDRTGHALFDGSVYTIGFDEVQLQLAVGQEVMRGEYLDQYEFSFQLDSLTDQHVGGSYPVFVDRNNYVQVMLNGHTRNVEVTMVKDGRIILRQNYPLQQRRMLYPDVKYSDFIEKNYRFASPTWIDTLYLSRHDVADWSRFADDMFDKFTIDYLRKGVWHRLLSHKSDVADHPGYNRLTFAPVEVEAVRLINKEPADLERHIYKLGVSERFKQSYHFRAVRRNDKLYLFVDGRELGMLPIHYDSSRIGFCAGNYPSHYEGIMYYHIGK